jgi:hypothetical protein
MLHSGLLQLTRNNVPFEWTDTCEKEFQNLKKNRLSMLPCYPTVTLGVLYEWRQMPLMVSWLASLSTRKDTQ